VLRVTVKHFGPIREADVTLGALTVFIGPNNAGKSYMALLLYALFRLFGRPASGSFRLRSWRRPVFAHIPEPSDDVKNELDRVLHLKNALLPPKNAVVFDELPGPVRDAVGRDFEERCGLLTNQLGRELQRCFGSELAALISPKRHSRFRLTIESTHPRLRITFGLKRNKLVIQENDYSFSGVTFQIAGLRDAPPDYRFSILLDLLAEQYFHEFLEIPYYFPAARSGILQSHRALAGAMVSRSPLVGIEPTEIPRLTGVVADFISNLLTLEARRPRDKAFLEIAHFLEAHLSRGKIDVELPKSGDGYPEMIYEADGNRFPMHRTSSMVSEIAPIVLFLKYVIGKHDLLMIEEPEAHLHPENQRKLARAIARMVNKGLHVLLTTHSDYFLQQLSNLMRMGATGTPPGRLGYEDADRLAQDDVKAYLFSFRADQSGTETKDLPVTAKEGIPEDAFVQVAESIYDETVKLERMAQT
jgi:predicted ATPase